jgi:tetratricopeptide (TPR) repeat protein
MNRASRCAAVVTLALAAVARAQDAAPPVETPESVAGKAAELVRDGKTAELAALAAKDKPDPWDVADLLCDRGAFDVADAFACAAPRVAVEALPGYVATTKQFPKAADGRRRLAEATSLLDGGQADQALAKLDDASPPVATELPVVPALRLRRVRGLALAKLTRTADAVKSLQSAADDADVAGWLTFAVRCRIDAAQTLQAAGDLAGTQAEWARIATLRERLGDRAGVGRALSNVGSFASLQGDYRGAMAFYEKAAAVFEGLGDKPEYRAMAGQVLANAGLVAQWLGRHAESLVLLERARDLQRAAGDRPGLAGTLSKIGQLHHATGSYERALECETEALSVALSAGDEAEAAAANGERGCALRQLGRLDEAFEALMRARDAYRSRNETLNAALAEVELARVERMRGRFAEAILLASSAETALRVSSNRRQFVHARLESAVCRLAVGDSARALADFEAVAVDADKLGLSRYAEDAVRGVAAAQLTLGRMSEASRSARRALDSSRLRSIGLSPVQLADRRASPSEDFNEVEIGARASVALADPEALCAFLEHGRAADVLSSIDGREAGLLRDSAAPPELRARESALREDEAAARHLLEEASATGDLPTIRERRGKLENATAAVAAMVERIHVESRLAASVLYPQPADLRRIRAALRPGETLVSFATVGDEAVALVVTAESGRIAELGPAKSVKAACAEFDASRAGAAAAEAANALHARLIAPLALNDAARRILVVPDGPMGSLPFVLLAPEFEVAYVPSATTYVLLAAQRDARGGEVLALGDPDVGAASGSVRLPGARGEARSVGDRVLLGADAGEAALRRLLDESATATPPRRWRGIHLACHGMVDETKPWMSALALAPGGGSDGRLTALDVAAMPVRADIVVLSACDTARGKSVRGDGVVGLPRAFLAAGASRVVVSLWKVDDEATTALMTRFYELWKDGGVQAATALRQAQAAVRAEKRWQDPVYWAAWQLWGLPD